MYGEEYPGVYPLSWLCGGVNLQLPYKPTFDDLKNLFQVNSLPFSPPLNDAPDPPLAPVQ